MRQARRTDGDNAMTSLQTRNPIARALCLIGNAASRVSRDGRQAHCETVGERSDCDECIAELDGRLEPLERAENILRSLCAYGYPTAGTPTQHKRAYSELERVWQLVINLS